MTNHSGKVTVASERTNDQSQWQGALCDWSLRRHDCNGSRVVLRSVSRVQLYTQDQGAVGETCATCFAMLETCKATMTRVCLLVYNILVLQP
jgi:hypothetical protein